MSNYSDQRNDTWAPNTANVDTLMATLGVGEERALISRALIPRLATALGPPCGKDTRERRLRFLIEAALTERRSVCATNKGYFIAKCQRDISEYGARLRSTANGLFTKAKLVDAMLETAA